MGHYTNAPEDNLLGLTDRRLLDEAEAEGVIRAENFLYDLPEETDFTVALLLDLHRAAFERVYGWAGQYRRSNPNVGSFLPPSFQQVPTLLYQFADEVQHRQQLVRTEAELAALLAYAHHRFVAIHPFTNGNGRTARLLTNFLAFRYGYQELALYQRVAGADREAYLTAIKAGNSGDYRELEKLISAQLRRFGE
ncbi:Fic/DOC family protein [Hymenobacter terricola]|uniref:Fic/DOC family protein n=1 Tax=Hymenobacter terricola TaxID=2819236 RepID=UPI001B30708A|nr:Fic family protein [Hymenobacter terricola]